MEYLKKYLLVIVLMFSINTVKSQFIENFSSSLETGNINNFFDLLAEDVEINILNNKTIDKNRAKVFLDVFFADKKSSYFKAIHKGASSTNSYYIFGELKSKNSTFKIYTLIRKNEKGEKIEVFRINSI